MSEIRKSVRCSRSIKRKITDKSILKQHDVYIKWTINQMKGQSRLKM